MALTHRVEILTRLEGGILLYLGILFFLNSIFHLTKINKREIANGSIFLSVLIALFSLFIIFGQIRDMYSIEIGGIALFFSCLYLWHNFNIIFNISHEGIGYFCLYFFVLSVVLIIYTAIHITQPWGIWLTASWISWAILLIMYYFMYVKKIKIEMVFGIYFIFISIASAWLPGILLLTGKLQ